jgi:two-component system response regulator FixJ
VADPALIAIVDDDDDLRRSTGDLLRAENYRVAAFTNGAEFIAAEPGVSLACILLDIEMPGLDGIGVLTALNDRGVRVPAIVVTGAGDVPTAVKAMRLGDRRQVMNLVQDSRPQRCQLETLGLHGQRLTGDSDDRANRT